MRNSEARNLIENDSFIDKTLTATLCNEELWLFSDFQIYEVYDAQFVDVADRSCSRAGNLCIREYSRLFVAWFSIQTTHELYALYTHNTWVV